MNDNISPEEKLLDIIKKGSGEEKSQSPAPRKFPDPGSLLKHLRVLFAPGSLLRWLAPVIFGLSLCFFVFALFNSFTPPSLKLRPMEEAQPPEVSAEGLEAQPPVESFIEDIKNKDIFNSASFGKGSSVDASLDGLRNIGLVGIIGEEPKQAIIKDKKNDEIYYLKEGESLGEFKLTGILEGKVIIEYRGERFEIHL